MLSNTTYFPYLYLTVVQPTNRIINLFLYRKKLDGINAEASQGLPRFTSQMMRIKKIISKIGLTAAVYGFFTSHHTLNRFDWRTDIRIWSIFAHKNTDLFVSVVCMCVSDRKRKYNSPFFGSSSHNKRTTIEREKWAQKKRFISIDFMIAGFEWLQAA